MINENFCLNEISATTGLSNKQIFHKLNILSCQGYNFSKKYFYSGDIIYELQEKTIPKKDIALITSPTSNQLKAVFISDLQLGNKKDGIDLLNRIYKYCIKEGIHIIINCRDILDGIFGSEDTLFQKNK